LFTKGCVGFLTFLELSQNNSNYLFFLTFLRFDVKSGVEKIIFAGTTQKA